MFKFKNLDIILLNANPFQLLQVVGVAFSPQISRLPAEDKKGKNGLQLLIDNNSLFLLRKRVVPTPEFKMSSERKDKN